MSQESFYLSTQQERLWLIEPYGPSACVQLEVALAGPLDEAALERALRETVRRHEILRTTFERQPGIRVPLQVVNGQLEPAWRTVDLRSLSTAEQIPALRETARKELAEPIDLASGPVVRAVLAALDGEQHTLLLTLSALHADVSSVSPLLGELIHHYAGAGLLAEDPLQYADYAEWQRETAASEEPPALEARAYWATFWGEASPALPFAKDATGAFAPAEVSLELDSELAAAVEAAAAAIGTSARTFVQAAWHVVLGHAAGEESVVVGLVESSVRHDDLVGALGAFLRPLPVRTAIPAEVSFAQIVEEIERARAEHSKSGDYALAELGGNLQIGFVANDDYQAQAGELAVALERVATSGPHFRLWAVCERLHGRLRVVLRFDPRDLEHEQVQALAGRLERLLRAAAADGHVVIGELDLLEAAERQRILVDFNDTAAPIPDRCVHELIAAQAGAYPGRAAVVDERGSLTYAQLETRANQLAHRLQRSGVGPEVAVGLCADRSLDMVVGLLGIIKAGGAYVPLNYEHPAPRLAAQIATAEVRSIVTQEALLSRLPQFDGEVVYLDRDRSELEGESTEAPTAGVSPENLVYVIYTSGSTGAPKGVGVTHGNLVNYATQAAALLGAEAEALAFGLVTSISTDLGNTSVFGSLCSGGTLVLVSPEAAADGSLLARQLEATPIDVLKITPSHIGALLAGGDSRLVPRRRLVLGGERAPWDLIGRIRELSAVPILNHYGPTETTVGCCTLEVPDGPGMYSPASVPIGRPIGNTSCYVLDERGRPAPVGVAGLLFVGGAGVARGYVGQPELTGDRFVADPFAPALGAPDSAPARMYDTGDRARWLPDGTLEFLGRADEQVKVHGYRVEPGEIETVLRTHPAVKEAVVVASDTTGDIRLVAYCICDSVVTPDELRSYLESRLPDFMIPAVTGILDELPRTPSGKVDRRALPDPETLIDARGPAYVAPRTPFEEAVALVWAQSLGVERVGARDDFFELGGHSLLATQVVAQLRADFAVDLPLHTLFISPTVEAFAQDIADLVENESEPDGTANGSPVTDFAPPGAR